MHIVRTSIIDIILTRYSSIPYISRYREACLPNQPIGHIFCPYYFVQFMMSMVYVTSLYYIYISTVRFTIVYCVVLPGLKPVTNNGRLGFIVKLICSLVFSKSIRKIVVIFEGYNCG